METAELWARGFNDLAAFVSGHADCGRLVGGDELPGTVGCRLFVACQCGETFDRWLPGEAAVEVPEVVAVV